MHWHVIVLVPGLVPQARCSIQYGNSHTFHRYSRAGRNCTSILATASKKPTQKLWLHELALIIKVLVSFLSSATEWPAGITWILPVVYKWLAKSILPSSIYSDDKTGGWRGLTSIIEIRDKGKVHRLLLDLFTYLEGVIQFDLGLPWTS